MHAAALGVALYDCRAQLGTSFAAVLPVLPDILLLLAGLLTMVSTKIYLDNASHPTWGDRPDGRRLRTLDPVQVVANYIMPNLSLIHI